MLIATETGGGKQSQFYRELNAIHVWMYACVPRVLALTAHDKTAMMECRAEGIGIHRSTTNKEILIRGNMQGTCWLSFARGEHSGPARPPEVVGATRLSTPLPAAAAVTAAPTTQVPGMVMRAHTAGSHDASWLSTFRASRGCRLVELSCRGDQHLHAGNVLDHWLLAVPNRVFTRGAVLV
jgi:hypothetical protein